MTNDTVMVRGPALGVRDLHDAEIDLIGGGVTATQVSAAAGAIAGIGAAVVGICPPAGAGLLAIAATAELVAFVMTA